MSDKKYYFTEEESDQMAAVLSRVAKRMGVPSVFVVIAAHKVFEDETPAFNVLRNVPLEAAKELAHHWACSPPPDETINITQPL